uniref:rho GTPase-activating protein 8 isoform X1 n=1 Tax=Myxine glutinosa TaxID=7769 RepID=UPI00358F75DA
MAELTWVDLGEDEELSTEDKHDLVSSDEPDAVLDPAKEGNTSLATNSIGNEAGKVCDAAPYNSTLDLSHPFYDIARHRILEVAGEDNYGRRVIVYSCCHMPPIHELNHHRLLQYMKYTLDQFIESDYSLVYFHHGLTSVNRPSTSWLRGAYKDFDRRYRKNLKALYVVHPSGFIKTVWKVFSSFISRKFSKKIVYVACLDELREHLKDIWLDIPVEVQRYDRQLKKRLAGKEGSTPKKTPPPRPPLPHQQFGLSLAILKEKSNGENIPLVLKQTVSYLKLKGLKTEGLFRRSATTQVVQEVKQKFNLGKPVNFEEYKGIHVAAVILKVFLRELPQPLLTFNLHPCILALSCVESSLRVTKIKEILNALSGLNYIVLKYLMCFLNMVAQQSMQNRMTAQNLAVVLGPNITWSQEKVQSLHTFVPVNIFTELCIDFYDNIFTNRTEAGEILP